MPVEVIVLRLLVPLTIFRWPLFGVVLAILADSIDWDLTTFRTLEDFGRYQGIDKLLDTYYLSFAFLVTLTWKKAMLRRTAMFLFFYFVLIAKRVKKFLITKKKPFMW